MSTRNAPPAAPVSVVVPVLNASATLEDALASILRCDAVGEVLVVDDGSTDGSADLAMATGDPRIRIVEGPRTGISGALNAGFAQARLDYILRCDADDRIVAESLRPRLDWLAARPGIVALSGGYASTTADGAHVSDLATDGAIRDVTALLRDGATITSFGTWLTRRAALAEVGGTRDWFVTAEDIDLQLRLAETGAVWHDPRLCYLYRLHDASITHRQPNTHRVFYEASARTFAAQRRAGGPDDLAAGRPPAPPARDPSRADMPMSARAQAAGHLESSAWLRHAEGRVAEARRLLCRSIRLSPLDLHRWKGLVTMTLRQRP